MKNFVQFSPFIEGIVSNGQQKNLPERLGYSAETTLLIIHADDLGMSHAENRASIHALEKGVVSSASVMVPCPWFPEIAAYAVTHPRVDLGIHLTLTSEWKHYKWRPVTPHDQVASLVDGHGFLNETTSTFMKNAKAADVEKELRSQIERALQFGIQPTHFDTHMGAALASPEFLSILLKLGSEYKVPVHFVKEFLQLFNYDYSKYLSAKDLLVDRTIMASSAAYKSGMEHFYIAQLKSLQPGLTVFLVHAAFDNDEMKAITIDHDDFGSAWRQQDLDFFTSEECSSLLIEQNVKVITWREVRDKLIR